MGEPAKNALMASLMGDVLADTASLTIRGNDKDGTGTRTIAAAAEKNNNNIHSSHATNPMSPVTTSLFAGIAEDEIEQHGTEEGGDRHDMPDLPFAVNPPHPPPPQDNPPAPAPAPALAPSPPAAQQVLSSHASSEAFMSGCAATTLQPISVAVVAAAAPTTPSSHTSLLLEASQLLVSNPSPLLGGKGGGDGGGLFDVVDEEERKKEEAEAEEKMRSAALAQQQQRMDDEERQRQQQQRLMEESEQQRGSRMDVGQISHPQFYHGTDPALSNHVQHEFPSNWTTGRNSFAQQQQFSNPQSQGNSQLLNPRSMTVDNQQYPAQQNPVQQPLNALVYPASQFSYQQPLAESPQAPSAYASRQQQQQPYIAQGIQHQHYPDQILYRDQNPSSLLTTTPSSSNVYGGNRPPPVTANVSAPVSHSLNGSTFAGMHNCNPALGSVPISNASPLMHSSLPNQSQVAGAQTSSQVVQPVVMPPTTLPFAKVAVSEPLLISSSGASLFGLRQPPHWSYQIQTTFEPPVDGGKPVMGMWLVRRRFRHVVALEERLRQECPGSILPPRPEKYATRALEEATAHQSQEFAMQRALELQVFLNSLIQHPYASNAHALRLFLSLQDDLGTAWAEVSSNALTRLANVSVGAAVSLSETTSRGMGVFNQEDYLPEDSAELLALQSAEASRMGAVLNAVPKLEGCIALLKDHAEQAGLVGMELQKAKSLDDLQPFEILASGMLRTSRRERRGVVELATALHTFSYHCKIVRNEKLAFGDRKQALLQRAKERSRIGQRDSRMAMHHRQYGGYNAYGGSDFPALDRGPDILMSDGAQECEEICRRVISEVARTSIDRKSEWSLAVRDVAIAMMESSSERHAIWSSVQEQFLVNYPDLR